MAADFFKKPFREAGINVAIPDREAITFIAEKILTELERGIVRPQTQAVFLNIVQRMKDEQGIDAVILGCTELPLLFNGVTLPVASLDTMQTHINALLDVMLADRSID